MILDLREYSPNQRYHIVTQTIIPRPIAWLLTTNDDGSHNLAPFSYFNAVCSDPAMVVLSVGTKPDGALKDTRRNLLSKRECVIHIPSTHHAQNVTATSASLAYADSELAKIDMPLVDFEAGLKRLETVAVAYRARYYDHHEIGPSKQGIIYCELLSLYVDDQCVHQDAKRLTIDTQNFDPLARLGAGAYSSLKAPFTPKA